MRKITLALLALMLGMVAFAQEGLPQDRSSLDEPPTGYVNGLFTVNEWGTQVYFSQGNLQYVDGEWRFAEHQWDYLGNNGQGSASEDVSRDLFGWGTSGMSHGSVSYQPWSTSQTPGDYYAYGDAGYDLFDESGQADWGANGIANGGNVEGLWRVPTREEWEWLLFGRTTTSGLRFAKAKVNVTTAVFYRTVSADFTPEEIKQYDMLCFFTPAGIQSLFTNYPEYEQGDQQLAIFGPSALAAAEARGLRVDLAAPTEECPSMPSALNSFLLKNL